jgi:hypothetical protein
MKKCMEDHVVEVKLLLLLLHHPLVQLPLLLLLPLDQVGVLQPLTNQLQSSEPCEVRHTQIGAWSPAQSYT